MRVGLHNASYEIARDLTFRQGPAQYVGKSCGRRVGLIVVRVCEQCGKQFSGLACRLLRPNHGRFCSRSCSSSFNLRKRNQQQLGPANPCWRGGASQRPSAYVRRYEAKYPEKSAASRAVQEALRSGLLVRPSSCSRCALSCKPHGHHDDYARPLDVTWLCRKCHRQRHVEIGRPQGRQRVAAQNSYVVRRSA
jgi:hypothetical protein